MSSLKSIVKHPAISLIDSATTLKDLNQIHAHLLVNGLLNDRHVTGQFIANIAIRNPTNLHYSDELLSTLSQTPTLFALNSMIRAHSKTPTPQRSFRYYNQILRSGEPLSPDNFTLNFMIRASTRVSARELGSSVHCAATKRGLENDSHFQTGLVSMYAETGCLQSSRRAYGEIPSPDVVAQTAMLNACEKCGEVKFARQVFDEMPHRDHVAWNAMIGGYVHAGRSREALTLFQSMQQECVKVNEVTMVLVLTACSDLGALDHGRWAHAYVAKNRLRVTVTLGTALVDMYGKCGDSKKAMEVFWSLSERNEYTWSAAMASLAMNGRGAECLELFSAMSESGTRPNGATFVAVLRGCSVAGLVGPGRDLFRAMKRAHGIEPESEHYGCLVDLHGRAGLLNEALEIIEAMPMKPHAGSWGSLLNAARMHKNLELGKLASAKIIELEAENYHCAYVQLSNMFADSKDWDGASGVRDAMRSRGVRKIPGCTVLESGGEVHEFFAGDKSHRRYGEIEAKLAEISRLLKLRGYSANTDPVLFDVDEEEKEDSLRRHSEKVAIALGLVEGEENDAPIRIVKNLRVCLDCHDWTKMVSMVYKREIVVRDRNRFHHFIDGECSCKGYW